MALTSVTAVYLINTAFDASGNSGWDQLTQEGPLEAMWPLFEDRPLIATWTPLRAKLWPRSAEADVLYFDGTYAIRKRALATLSVILNDAEFLPLSVRDEQPFFVIHPLRLVPLASSADIEVALRMPARSTCLSPSRHATLWWQLASPA